MHSVIEISDYRMLVNTANGTLLVVAIFIPVQSLSHTKENILKPSRLRTKLLDPLKYSLLKSRLVPYANSTTTLVSKLGVDDKIPT